MAGGLGTAEASLVVGIYLLVAFSASLLCRVASDI